MKTHVADDDFAREGNKDDLPGLAISPAQRNSYNSIPTTTATDADIPTPHYGAANFVRFEILFHLLYAAFAVYLLDKADDFFDDEALDDYEYARGTAHLAIMALRYLGIGSILLSTFIKDTSIDESMDLFGHVKGTLDDAQAPTENSGLMKSNYLFENTVLTDPLPTPNNKKTFSSPWFIPAFLASISFAGYRTIALFDLFDMKVETDDYSLEAGFLTVFAEVVTLMGAVHYALKDIKKIPQYIEAYKNLTPGRHTIRFPKLARYTEIFFQSLGDISYHTILGAYMGAGMVEALSGKNQDSSAVLYTLYTTLTTSFLLNVLSHGIVDAKKLYGQDFSDGLTIGRRPPTPATPKEIGVIKISWDVVASVVHSGAGVYLLNRLFQNAFSADKKESTEYAALTIACVLGVMRAGVQFAAMYQLRQKEILTDKNAIYPADNRTSSRPEKIQLARDIVNLLDEKYGAMVRFFITTINTFDGATQMMIFFPIVNGVLEILSANNVKFADQLNWQDRFFLGLLLAPLVITAEKRVDYDRMLKGCYDIIFRHSLEVPVEQERSILDDDDSADCADCADLKPSLIGKIYKRWTSEIGAYDAQKLREKKTGLGQEKEHYPDSAVAKNPRFYDLPYWNRATIAKITTTVGNGKEADASSDDGNSNNCCPPFCIKLSKI